MASFISFNDIVILIQFILRINTVYASIYSIKIMEGEKNKKTTSVNYLKSHVYSRRNVFPYLYHCDFPLIKTGVL